MPATPGARQAALRHAADRVETALAGLERPLSQYLLELEPERVEGRSWYAGPGAGELVEWRPVLDRAGVRACPNRVAAVYLELAVLVRALEGLATAATMDAAPDRSSLWAGLFDLQDTLLGSTVDDLRALEGLATAASLDAPPDRSSLWAGLFDLQDTLLGSTVDDLRALAA